MSGPVFCESALIYDREKSANVPTVVVTLSCAEYLLYDNGTNFYKLVSYSPDQEFE